MTTHPTYRGTILLLMCVLSVFPDFSAGKKPHIVLIVADDLGHNDVSWHNYQILTPTLQALADDGIILEQHYAQPKCAPSRAALLTGLYPYKLGRQHESLPPMMPTGLSTKFKLLPQFLKEGGYSTHAVGKWHLGYCSWDYTPTRRGFDSFFGFYSHSEDYYSRQSSDSSKVFNGYDLRENETVSKEGAGQYSANLFSDRAVKIISSHSTEQPMFLYLAYQSIHKPIQVPYQYARMYQPYGKPNKESLRRGMISALDEGIRNVTRALNSNNMLQDTVIIVLSDNGGYAKGSNWPLRGRKNSVYEGGTRTVALFYYARLKKELRGRISNSMVHITDWTPTILNLAGVEVNGTKFDGIDQSLHLTAGWPGPRNEFVYNINDALRITAAIRVARWKLIWGYPEGLTSQRTRKETRMKYIQSYYQASKADLLYLYDVKNDPNETRNLAKTKRGVVRYLKGRIRSILGSGEVVPPDTPRVRLRSLPAKYGGIVSPGWCTAK